jgi:hypothetical protein
VTVDDADRPLAGDRLKIVDRPELHALLDGIADDRVGERVFTRSLERRNERE